MKVGIISDTHDQVARTSRAVARLMQAGAEALIHCGDLTGADIVYECGALPCSYVLGNNDDEVNALKRAIAATGGTFLGRGGFVEIGGARFGVTHGDLFDEARRLIEAEPDYFLSGHTHAVSDRTVGKVRCINPGALHRASEWTVAVLDLETKALEILELDRRSEY